MQDVNLGLQYFGQDSISRVQRAMGAFREGRPVILLDDDTRENEADMIFAAEKTTPETINFMLKHTSGVICLCITDEKRRALQLPFMVETNENSFQTAFTVSIEARTGISTGVSAKDRAHTILVATNPNACADDLVKPGHMFPLCARDGGVFTRRGHTEGSIDLAQLSGLVPSSVLCELMNPDGTMARAPEAFSFAKTHDLIAITIEDIVTYRNHIKGN